MAKFKEKEYKGMTIGRWVGDNTYFVMNKGKVLGVRKSEKACEKVIDKLEQ